MIGAQGSREMWVMMQSSFLFFLSPGDEEPILSLAEPRIDGLSWTSWMAVAFIRVRCV